MAVYHSEERECTLYYLGGVGARLVSVTGDDPHKVVEEEVSCSGGEEGKALEDVVDGMENVSLKEGGREGEREGGRVGGGEMRKERGSNEGG